MEPPLFRPYTYTAPDSDRMATSPKYTDADATPDISLTNAGLLPPPCEKPYNERQPA